MKYFDCYSPNFLHLFIKKYERNKIIDTINKIRSLPVKTVIDFGCGNGFYLNLAASCASKNVICIDQSTTKISEIPNRINNLVIIKIQGDICFYQAFYLPSVVGFLLATHSSLFDEPLLIPLVAQRLTDLCD